MLKVIELLFNPRAKDRILKSFSFEGKTDLEQMGGSMHLVVEVTSALPPHARLIDKLASTIRDAYYSSAGKKTKKKGTPEGFLQQALRVGNEYLRQEVKKGSVDWIGNLHVAVLVLTASKDQSSVPFRFSTLGNMKVLMARSTSLIDIQKTVESSRKDIAIGPSFSSIVSGVAVPGDKVLVITYDLYQECTKRGVLEQIPSVQGEKQLQSMFQDHHKEIAGIPGILTALFFRDGTSSTPDTPLSRMALLLRKPLLWKFKTTKHGTGLTISSLVRKQKWIQRVREYSHPLSLVASLIAILFLGSLFFGWFDSWRDQRTIRKASSVAEEMIEQASQKHKEGMASEAYSMLTEANDLLLPYEKNNVFVQDLLFQIKEKIFVVTGMEQVQKPDLLHAFPQDGTYNVIASEKEIFAYSSALNHILLWKGDAEDPLLLEIGSPVLAGAMVEEIPFFLKEDGRLTWLKEGKLQDRTLEFPAGFTPTAMVGYADSLYVLDKESGTILRIADPVSSFPTPWLQSESIRRPVGAQHMAIDGNIWLVMNGAIERYYRGMYEEEFLLNLVPPVLEFSAIETGRETPFLVLLASGDSRIVIVEKESKHVRQMDIPIKEIHSIALVGKSTLLISSSQGIFRISIE